MRCDGFLLRQTPRPDSGLPARPGIAWKTGTSWGFRDAWTAGVFGRHVLVVWIGQFDGVGNPAFIGIHAAAPLYLRIVDAQMRDVAHDGKVTGEVVVRSPWLTQGRESSGRRQPMGESPGSRYMRSSRKNQGPLCQREPLSAAPACVCRGKT